MNDKIIVELKKLGINLLDSNHPISREVFNYHSINEPLLKKIIEFSLAEFIVDIQSLKKIDINSYEYYLSKISNTKDLNFWGEQFEISIHSKMYKLLNEKGIKIRRGIRENAEADFVIESSTNSFMIETATRKYNDFSNMTYPIKKIQNIILKKNSLDYANCNCALFVNTSNILFNEKIGKLKLEKTFQEFLTSLKEKIKFGRILLFESVFTEYEENLKHELKVNEFKYNDSNSLMKNVLIPLQDNNNNRKENSSIYHKWF